MNSQLIKRLSILQIIFAVIGCLVFADAWPATSAAIAIALALLLFSREEAQDERVDQLKFRAIRYGVVVGLFVTVIMNLCSKMLRWIVGQTVPALSAFDVIIVMLLTALIMRSS